MKFRNNYEDANNQLSYWQSHRVQTEICEKVHKSEKGTSMRYAKMSASGIQVRLGIGHQWRYVRLRKTRGAGGGGRGAPRDFGGRAPKSVSGKRPMGA